MRSRLTFRSDVPNSLFGEYMEQLPASDYLLGPRQQWSYFRGRWSAPYEGIRTVEQAAGPFALWTGQSFEDGVIEAVVSLPAASESASLLLRSRAEKDDQHGYEVIFEPRRQRVTLRRHADDIKVLAAATASLRETFTLALSLTGPRIQVWIDPSPSGWTNSCALPAEGVRPKPLLDVIDPKPVVAKGWLGVRASGGAVNLDHLRLSTSLGTVLINEEPNQSLSTGPAQAPLAATPDLPLPGRAWRSFCLLLLNLNEFVYVD
jgi:hypothetical protein